MKEKILNVKNILKIILILFILFNMAKSCSYANSLNTSGFENFNYNGDILEFFNQILKGATGYNFEDDDIPLGGSTNSSRWSTFLNNLSSDSYQYFSFSLQKRTGSSYGNQSSEYNSIYISYFNNTSTNGGYNGEIYLTTTSTPYITIGNLYNYSSTGIGITSEFNSITKSKFVINKNNSNIRTNQLWYKATANTIEIQSRLEFRPLYDYIKTINNKQFYISEWTLGFSYIELGELINWENRPNLKGEMYKWTSSTSYEYIGSIRILVDGRTQIQTNNIYYNQGYLIRFTYGEGESTGFYNFYFVPYGGNSGDFSGELIYKPSDPNEYKPITNTINENNNMWKDIYNSLFVMDSGDVQQLKNRISGELMEVIDGKNDYTEEYELLDTLNNTRPTDFIISWKAVQYENQNFIPSGEINFNNIVTEWGLTEVHRVLKIIVVGALAFVGARALWKCITITLGIGMEMYDENKEEENIVTEIDEDTGRTTQYTNTTRGNRTRVNIKDKTIEKPHRRIGFK